MSAGAPPVRAVALNRANLHADTFTLLTRTWPSGVEVFIFRVALRARSLGRIERYIEHDGVVWPTIQALLLHALDRTWSCYSDTAYSKVM